MATRPDRSWASTAPEAAAADGVVRLMIVADTGMMVDALHAALEGAGAIQVVAVEASLAAAVQTARLLRPDLVVLDFRLPDGEAPDVISALTRRPLGAAVVVLSASADYRSMTRALDAGAAGFLSKDQRLEELVEAIHAVMAGEMVVAPSLLPVLLGPTMPSAPGAPGRRLSRREADVLQLLADGASNPDIAIRLQLSPHTVRNHVQHIFARLGAHSRLEAVTIGLRGGLISPPSRN